jgi:uncharacterized protein YndB with AHSA1/START domain
MPAKTTTSKPNDRELQLTSIIDASREKVYRCWTEPELITQWFTPPPWKTIRAETDVRPGGSSLIVMQGPEGQEMPNPGVYLEVVPNEKLVATDAFVSAWKPSEKPFMTLVLTFEDAGKGKTKYTARILHWSADDRIQHEKMGFEKGWTQATKQLAELAERI